MVSRQRRPTQWFDARVVDEVVLTGAVHIVELLDLMDDAVKRGSTVTRTLLHLTLRPESVAQLSIVMFGVAWVDNDARAAGVLPDLNTDVVETDWLVKGQRTVHGNVLSFNTYMVVDLDLRGQRVCQTANDNLLLLVHNTTGFTIRYDGLARVLMKLR